MKPTTRGVRVEPKKVTRKMAEAQRKPKPTTNDIVAAWLFDRAEQYSNDSCCRAVFDELIGGARNGDAQEDFEHGDLDDILRNWGFEVPR